MELLDIYDENGNHIGTEDRSVVHRDALWHNTVHCWLFNKEGYVYFQKRREEGTLYTTASGHIQAGESIKEGFGREIEEEIGCKIDYENAELVDVVKFVLDRENKDGTMFRDRVFANVYVCEFDDDVNKFKYDPNEVSALVLVKASEPKWMHYLVEHIQHEPLSFYFFQHLEYHFQKLHYHQHKLQYILNTY